MRRNPNRRAAAAAASLAAPLPAAPSAVHPPGSRRPRPARRPPRSSPQARAARREARRKTVVAVCIAVALCFGSWLIQRGADIQDPPPVPSAAEAFPAAGPPVGPVRGERAVPPLPAAVPTRVRIPAIDVDAPLQPLGLLQDGSLASPRDDESNLAGWYADGAAPGATGTAVVAGHVDTATGPAVFYNVGALKKGYRVEVARADGRTALFTIDAIEVYSRTDFPSQKVYGPSKRAELRVITCGGGFSEESHAYLGNVVVYAHLTGVR
ncbi:class F sortase [Streptomyces sp. AA8]|nr:class F sortase [Streptomyces telluris]